MNGWNVTRRNEREVEHTYGVCSTGGHYQRSSQRGKSVGRGECRRIGFRWCRVQEDQSRKRIGYGRRE